MKLIIVGCGAQKRDRRSEARDLYTGPIFSAARKYADRAVGDRWWVLSARYGLINCQTEIDPYDHRYDPSADRVRLIDDCRLKLGQFVRRIHRNYAGGWWVQGLYTEVEVLAGADYCDLVRDALFGCDLDHQTQPNPITPTELDIELGRKFEPIPVITHRPLEYPPDQSPTLTTPLSGLGTGYRIQRLNQLAAELPERPTPTPAPIGPAQLPLFGGAPSRPVGVFDPIGFEGEISALRELKNA